MKTHELARALSLLAKWLRSQPDVELAMLDSVTSGARNHFVHHQTDAVGLSALVAFSKFSKQQWAELIKEYELPVNVLPTHSARDVMGKLMGFFADNPDARRGLMDRVGRQPSEASPELMKALASLLRD